MRHGTPNARNNEMSPLALAWGSNERIPKFDSSWLDFQTALKIGGLLNRNLLFSNPVVSDKGGC
jgi:hypothetical protein